MVAYNFKTEFAGRVANGSKYLTLRAPRAGRSRHARVGEPLQLTTGARTTAVRRLLADPHCALRARVVLGPHGVVRVTDLDVRDGDARSQGVAAVLRAAEQGSPEAARWGDVLARLDGFDSYEAMYAWHLASSDADQIDAAGYVERQLIGWRA